MSFFEWSNDFDLGVHAMNDEHHKLIELMKKLYDLNDQGASHNELKKCVDELTNYTVQHFADEEAYMESIKFPGLATHKIIHQQLLKQFGEKKLEFEKLGAGVPQGFFQFLKLWLTAHIKGIDMKYGHHAASLKKAS